MIQHWFGYSAPGGAAASRWISAIFGALVFAYGGWVFIRGAVRELADRSGKGTTWRAGECSPPP